jgi:hypothetical protein
MAAPPPEHGASTPPDASRRDAAVQTEPQSLSPEEQLRVTALVRPAWRLEAHGSTCDHAQRA